MKKSVLLPLLALAAVGTRMAHADNVGLCYWYPNQADRQLREFNLTPVYSVNLNQVKVGGVMSYYYILVPRSLSLKCPLAGTARINWRYVPQLPLVDGYADVYRSNLPGVGIRFNTDRGMSGSFKNESALVAPLMETLEIQLIRTGRGQVTGLLDMNFALDYQMNDWTPARFKLGGTTRLTGSGYFSGCVGVEKLSIPMGRVMASRIGEGQPRAFNLDVLCAGLPAGSKLPVKVYFEGNSAGPGRLDLTPGGATGVEIALTTDNAAMKLPFTRAGALDMAWTRTEATGELYRLPISAQYVRKGTEAVGAGRADAVLNYILEYN